MSTQPRVPFARRGAAALVFGLFATGGLVVIFASTLARSTSLEAQAREARGEVAALQERVELGRRELAFLDSTAFVDQQARRAGLGTTEEIAFGLPPNAPSPPDIAPLGPAVDDREAETPFEAWMELLFGA